ncbi:B12-binding domain-containing radical SAM protein [Candidatus Omnitrophota bacterium]
MRIALVVPPDKSMKQGQYHDIPQLGVGYLASCLLKAGYDCQVVDAKMKNWQKKDTVEKLREIDPAIIGFSAMTHEIVICHDIAAAIKRHIPKAICVVGGWHVTALPARTMEEFPLFDYGVVGEGEETLEELILALKGGLDISSIEGLTFRKDGKVSVNPARDFIKDLNAVPFPAWDLVPSTHIYPMFTSRGCPFQCNFCMRSMGRRVRFRSTESVMAELDTLITKFGARDIRFRDETFTMNRSRVIELLDKFLEYRINKKAAWSVTTHVSTVDEELLRRMKKAGCVSVGFGIESGNDGILKRMGKSISVKKSKEAVAAAKRAGLKTGAFFILGHPSETLKSIRDTQRLAVELNTTTVNFGSMVPYPGTALYDMALHGEGGYKIISYNWSDWNKYLGNAIEMEGLPRRLLEKEQMRGYILFYLKNLRLLDALKFFWLHRGAIMAYCRRLLVRRGLTPSP